jgi:TolB protein
MTMRIARGRSGLVAAAATVALSAGLAGPALASRAPAAQVRVLGAGQTGTRAEVPWRKVGPAWALAMFSRSTGGEGVKPTNGSATLYLVDPSGGKYSLFTWSARSRQAQRTLVAWSGDTQRAMFLGFGRADYVYQLQLRTGKITSFRLPANVSPVGYTRPDGTNVLADKSEASGQGVLQRYSLTGKLQRTLATVPNGDQVAAYQPGGVTLAVSARKGLQLISNAGGVIRKLPVPGVTYACNPVRWWSANTILASCFTINEGWRMWLVPASGARPSALTPARTGTVFDMGDFNAWQLSSGLYVDGYGPCATLVIGKQPAHGPEQQVNVPGADSSLIVTATRSSLMVERINGCSPGVSLVWFNPATRAMKVALATHGNQYGVVGIAPYFVTGKF